MPIVSMAVPGTDLKDGGSVNEHCYGNWVFPAIPSSYYDFAYEEGSAAQKSDQVRRAANREYAAAGVGDYMPASVWCTDSDLLTEMADLQTNIENAISTACMRSSSWAAATWTTTQSGRNTSRAWKIWACLAISRSFMK